MNYKTIILSLALLLGVVSVANAEISKDYGGDRTINLKEGWNLVTIYAPGSQMLFDGRDDHKLKNISAIYLYDRNVKEYIRAYPQPEHSKIKNFLDVVGDVERGGDPDEYGATVNMSIWVYSTTNQTMKYTAVDGPLPHKHVGIKPGWNFLSVTPEYAGKTLSQLVGSCQLEAVLYYNRDGGKSEWVDLLNNKDFTSDPFDMSAVGAGYVVKAKNECKMGEVIPLAPALPN